MYFVNSGRVQVVSSDGNTVFATLSPGSYFGETALLMNQPRNACVRAVDYVDLYTLNRATLGQILEKFPAFQKHLHELAAERQAGNKR
jgi:voltage-gated potassium channel